MNRSLSVWTAILFACFCAPAWAENCDALADTLIPQVKTSSYADFDDVGWRTLAAKGCFLQSGKSIVTWLSAHGDATAEQTRSLRYHAARVFAMTGRKQVALIHLKHSKNPDQAPDDVQNWNAYIDAFSAWLLQDIGQLRTSIQLLEAQPLDDTGYKPNLISARRFLACYNSAYADIETDTACLKAATQMKNLDPISLESEPK